MKENKRSESEETERASTPEEIELAKELLAAQKDAVASEEVKGDSAREEFKWLGFLKSPDAQKFVDDGLITLSVSRGENGEFEKVEIRRNGRIVFYSNNKDFDELVRKANGWDKVN
ncbi:MAG: hypothetical protein Q8P49_01255 [Candidatus Liptonbacteria bacterium]|nr:hypothetical protein [Candidatus Liptonbacteria bacterium]